jgi:ADP-heptose:LPS heptosyltransferase
MHDRYCIFRTDAIGDLILTLPMAFAVKAYNPSATVVFCVQEYTEGIVRLCPAIDDTVAVPQRDLQGGINQLAGRLRKLEITTAIFAYPRPMLALAARFAGIPERVGTAYRFYSFLFTKRHSEHRRESVRHESAYNLNLLTPLGITDYTPRIPLLAIPESIDLKAGALLSETGIGDDRFIILHPGSGGSARDWDARSFGELGAEIARNYPSHRILVTGSAQERPIVEDVVKRVGPRAAALPAPVSLDVFAGIIKHADTLVANSTGPLHIAAALGVRVVGLYADDQTFNPRRWGPLGDGHAILTPKTVSNQQVMDISPMNLIRVEHVYDAVQRVLSGTESL